MDIKEFKILLKLLRKNDYKSPPGELNPNKATKVTETRNLCRQLSNRGFVELTEKIEKIAITSTGKTLIKQKDCPEVLQEIEWKLLQHFSQAHNLKPSDIKIKSLKAPERDEIISNATKRGFLKVTEEKIIEVILTEEGKEFLATEYLPTGGNITLSSQMLESYLRFIRKYKPQKDESSVLDSKINLPKPTDKEVLQTIIDLDKELNMDNYLPIFHVRNKLQPSLTRDELNQALYRLQQEDKLSMDCLVEASEYTAEEYDAGIPTNSAGPLFFIILSNKSQ